MATTQFDPNINYKIVIKEINQALSSLGYGNRFVVSANMVKNSTFNNKGATITFKIKDTVTGKTYDNIHDATEAISIVKNGISRQRNVDPNAKAVKVQKGAAVSSRKSQYYNSVGGYEQSLETEWNLKLNNARKQVSDYNRKTGQERIKVKTYPDVRMVFFVVTLTGEQFYDFNMAKACADELIWNKAKHSSEDIGDAIYHCLIDDDFMNLRMSQLRFGKN